jgi:autophagy-related protein 5
MYSKFTPRLISEISSHLFAMEGAAALPLTQQLWAGTVPVKFDLSPASATSLQSPIPYFAMVPRQSYLSALVPALMAHFKSCVRDDAADTDLWIEAEAGETGAKVPLQWHVPVGVLFDLLGSAPSAGVARASSAGAFRTRGRAAQLPWPLVAHFQGHPAKRILRLPADREEWTKRRYFNSLKQALFLQHGTTQPMMSLSAAKQSRLWSSLVDNSAASFVDAAAPLLTSTADLKTRAVPVRLFLRNGPVVQRPVRAEAEDGSATTLREAVEAMLPSVRLGTGGGGVPRGRGGGEAESAGAGFSFEAEARGAGTEATHEVVVAGLWGGDVCGRGGSLTPVIDQPVAQLHRLLRHPDSWLYVSVVAL